MTAWLPSFPAKMPSMHAHCKASVQEGRTNLPPQAHPPLRLSLPPPAPPAHRPLIQPPPPLLRLPRHLTCHLRRNMIAIEKTSYAVIGHTHWPRLQLNSPRGAPPLGPASTSAPPRRIGRSTEQQNSRINERQVQPSTRGNSRATRERGPQTAEMALAPERFKKPQPTYWKPDAKDNSSRQAPIVVAVAA